MEYLPLFVYGTLRNGFGNYNHILRGHTEKEIPATMKGIMLDIGAFPAVVFGDGTVQGELMYIKPDDYVRVMQECDLLEGFNPDSDYSMYERKNIVVKVGQSKELAWAYIWALPTRMYSQVECGDWALYRYGR